MRQLSTHQDAAAWLRERVKQGALHTDSRKIQAGDGFIAWPGAAVDGRKYVAASLAAGATACLVEHEGAIGFGFADERVASYSGLKAASGHIAAAYFAHPSHALDILAVTGTNGKTSTAWWIAQAINILNGKQTLTSSEHSSQYSCGLVGTLGIGIPGAMANTGLTTPDPVMLQSELTSMRQAGATACAIEASSIGLAEHRMAGLRIHTAIFTNFTQDHLDYHGSMEAYWRAKKSLFDWPGLQAVVINIDDPKGLELVSSTQQRGLQVTTISQLRTDATLYASGLGYDELGMHFDVHEGSARLLVRCPSIGEYNVANALGVLGALRSVGISLRDAATALGRCTAVPGRMQMLIEEGQPLVLVDYAHTPDALAKALDALRPMTRARGGKLWCVFGCGGNRDASKRPLMARAAMAADHIIVTSDNPRDEPPDLIVGQVMAGFPANAGAQAVLARAQAISHAVTQAQQSDVLLIAG
ncbi:MAG: UDP-N-acetylmuramoyl-L-alanyl-D-glutamate--2,6-diaminopimelate ligase, partial [Brachymonas sp.]